MCIFNLKKNEILFEKNKKKSVGIVMGWERKQQISLNSFTCNLLIKIPEISDNGVFLCITSGVNPADYPIGREVDIYYTRGTGRIPVVKARLIENSHE